MFKLTKFFLGIVFLVAVLILAAPLLIGWYLSPQDEIKKSDVIVAVSGGDNDARIKKAVRLYREGWAPYIIYSGAAAEGDVSNALAMKNISVDMGVPESRIFMEEYSRDTQENAKLTKKIIEENGFRSMILVTSPYHQRRTMNLFREELGGDFEIINQSAIDEDWRRSGWWRDEEGRFLTAAELAKILFNYVQGWRFQ